MESIMQGGDDKYIDIYEKLIRETDVVNGFYRSGDKLERISFTTTLGSIEWKGKTYNVAEVIQFFRNHDGWVEESSLSFRWIGIDEQKDTPLTATQKVFRGIGALVSIVIVLTLVAQISLPSSNDSSTSASVGTVSNTEEGEYEPSPRPARRARRYAHGAINIREGRGTQHSVVHRLSRGDAVEILPDSLEDGWTVVFKGGRRLGYIYADLLETSPLPDIEIVDWSWHTDPSFGTDGTVRYSVELRNNTSRYVRNVRVDFTTYDAGGNLIDTDFTYISGLSPGGTASGSSYATYYGREERARLRVNPSSY